MSVAKAATIEKDPYQSERLSPWHDYVARLEALLEIGEWKVAVDAIRKRVISAKQAPSGQPAQLLILLSLYAKILEETRALAEAEYVRAEAIELISTEQIQNLDAAEAYLRHGLLLVKMHDYDRAIARFQDAFERVNALTGIEDLDRQIMLARIWRGQSEALEALGELSGASNALDTLTNVKRLIRFLVFSTSRGG